MKNKKKDNKNVSIIASIVAVALIIMLSAGGTYAYWTWISNTASGSNQRTDYNLIIASPSFTITGTNVTGKLAAPTSTCYNASYTLAGRATVVANNVTDIQMQASLTLSAKLTSSTGTASSADLTHVHWAIHEVTASTTAFAAANCSTATANGAAHTTGTFTTAALSANTNYTTTVNFTVPANTSTTKYYQLYVWIDSGYTHQNVGSVQSDPLQDMQVYLTFSNTSTFAQVQS